MPDLNLTSVLPKYVGNKTGAERLALFNFYSLRNIRNYGDS